MKFKTFSLHCGVGKYKKIFQRDFEMLFKVSCMLHKLQDKIYNRYSIL